MAVKAGTAIHPVVRSRTPKGVESCVERPGMTCCIMAALAKLWHAVCQEFPLIAAVDRMTSLTVLLHRRMLPEKRSPFFRMAFITELVDRSGPDELLSEPAVMVMTIRAFDLALAKRMMGLFGDLAAYIPMAGKTEIGLRRFQIHPFTGMNRVAIVARNTGRFVRSHIPLGKAPGIAVTVEAFGGFCNPIDFLIPENEDVNTATAAFLDMGFSIAMAGFAPFRICRTFANSFFCVGRIDIGVVMTLVAELTSLRLPSFFGACGHPWRGYPKNQDHDGE